ncbi:MAG: hypothetical protein IJW23_05225 [Lentisphaeria bacterium]|nr:hypothetical protein [Lentisphaeria bacterium]
MITDFKISWALKFSDRKQTKIMLTPDMMESHEVSTENNKEIHLFRGCEIAGKEFEVRISFRHDGTDLRYGSIQCRNNRGKFFMEELHFPVITANVTGEFKSFHGAGQGWLITLSEKEYFTTHPMRSLQMTAGFAGNQGIYLDARDKQYNLKESYWEKIGDRVTGKITHLLPYRKGRNAELKFECGIGLFEGAWFEAAKIYRKWAETTPNFKKKFKKNPMREIGIWAWNRGPGDHVSDPIIKLSKDAGVPAALDWYWWHKNPYDTDYPEFWPPREGKTKFTQTLAKLKKAGVYTQVYVNGMAWDMEAPSFPEGGMDSVVINQDGSVYGIVFNTYTKRKLCFTCGQGKPFQDRLEQVLANIIGTGIPGVYLDMIGAANVTPCYNPAHKHSHGGGNYHISGNRKFLERLHKRFPGTVFSTEDCNESLLGCFESMIVLHPSCERLASSYHAGVECVPAYSAVYHGIAALFGNYAIIDGIPPWDPLWPDKDRWQGEEEWEKLLPDQFCCELARTVIWGMQPTVCKLTMEQANLNGRYGEFYRFLVMICRFYYENRDFLYDGDMLNPAGFETETTEVKFLQRFIFTTRENGKIVSRDLPAVLHSLWESPAGEKALFVINYTGKPRTFTYGGITKTLPPRSAEKILL